MKKKIIIGAVALMGVFGGLTAWQSLSGQNEAKANCAAGAQNGYCIPGINDCYAGIDGVDKCDIGRSHPL